MSLRQEFATLAQVGDVSFSELCRRYQVSRQTGYKWRQRSREENPDLTDRSRRPATSPFKTPLATEELVLAIRADHRTWGGRKIAARMHALGHERVPSASTITEILRRNNLLDPQEAQKHTAWQRFEHSKPNELWQMDFKGFFRILEGNCYPLTILDDHSRFNIDLRACANQKTETVQAALKECFRRYGLPDRMLMDNAGPWGSLGGITGLEAWLMRLDIKISHGRPFHPQTQGKDERFHRTLKADVLQFAAPLDFAGCHRAFSKFRHVYNHERPHEAIGMQVPASRYSPSQRSYRETLPPIEYAPGDCVRRVYAPGQIRFGGRRIVVGAGVLGHDVAVRPTVVDGVYNVVFCNSTIREIDLRISLTEA